MDDYEDKNTDGVDEDGDNNNDDEGGENGDEGCDDSDGEEDNGSNIKTWYALGKQ